MANESGDYDQDLENRILKIIYKIREKRNRPCFQSIHAKLTQGGKDINIDDLKVFVENLVNTGLLINKGSAGKETFYVANEEHNLQNGDPPPDNNISHVESFIDKKFYETLITRINDEVKKSVKLEFESYVNENKLKVINNDEECCNEKSNNEKLLDEIELLRAELKTKDEIIKKLRNRVNTATELRDKTKHKNNSVNANMHKKNTTQDIRDLNPVIDDSKLKKRSVTIIGDSIVKEIKPFKMKRMLGNDKLYVKSFSGATTSDMADYCKPTIRRNPNIIILHARTNNLNTGNDPNSIASDIVKLALDMKTDVNEVNVSSLIARNDKLNDKALKVNNCLELKCSQVALGFIDNSNVTNEHLNKGGIHLNFKGTVALTKNFMTYIQN